MNKKFFQNDKNILVITIALLAVICYFPLFLHLSSIPIRMWDESRLALSAYEMMHGSNWLVPHYQGEPDMWNTKPPLMIWLEAFGSKILGYNELAIRLPAAFAALATCAILVIFCLSYLRSMSLACTSVLVLITASGYVQEHVSRTGDYDSLLTLFTTTYILCYFIFIESGNERRRKYLLYFFIALTLTVLSKGIQGLMFLPSLFIFTVIKKKTVSVFKEKNFYIGAAIFILFAPGYYLLRNVINPGYLYAVWQNELGGRYLTALEGHRASFWFYFNDLISETFNYWYLLFLCGVVVGLAYADRRIRNLTGFLTLCIFQYLIALSSAQTKLAWYESPLFPLLAIVTAIFLSWIFNALQQQLFKYQLISPVAGFIVLFLFFVKPYTTIFSSVYENTKISMAERINEVPAYLKYAIESGINIDGSKIIYNDYYSSILCYQRMLDDRGMHATLASVTDLQPGDKVISSEPEVFSAMENKFNVELLREFYDVRVYHLSSLK